MKRFAHPMRRRPLPLRLLSAALLGFGLITPRTEAGQVFYVNDNTLANDRWCMAVGNDANSGLSSNAPKATVQSVIATYNPGVGATIYVDAGTYLLTEDLVLPDTGAGNPAGEWFQLIGAGARTVLDRQSTSGDSVCLRIRQDCAKVDGFLFRKAKTGIVIEPGSCRNAVLANNVLTANSGYAIHVLPDPSDTGVDHYTIRNNLLYGNAGGMNLQADAGYRRACFTVENNTVDIYGQTAISLGGQSQGTVLRNNILSVKGAGHCLRLEQMDALSSCNYNNLYAQSGAGVARWFANGAYLTAVTLADWQNATGWDGASLGQDPRFVSATDFHLRSVNGSWRGTAWVADTATSPCIDAGDPASPFGVEPQPNGGRVNMGAYGNTEQASKSSPVRSLTLLAPRTGEVWPRPTTITWSATGTGWLTTDSVRLEYAIDTGPWTNIPYAGNLPASGSFNWEAPNSSAASAIFRIRATCNRDATITATTVSAPVGRTAATYYINDASTAGDRYCSAPGASGFSGKSPGQPVLSLAILLQIVTLGPGDTVYWDAGAYSQSVNTVIDTRHTGAPGAPIRIVGVPSATQLVRQGTGTGRYGLLIQADHVRVEGLTCKSATMGLAVDALTARNVALLGNSCISNDFGIFIQPSSNGVPLKGEYQILQNVILGGGASPGIGDGIHLQGGYNLDGTDSKAVFIVENNTVRTPRICIRMVSKGNASQRTHYLKNNIFETTGTDGNSICIVTHPTTLNYSDYNNLYAPGGFVGAWEGSGAMFTNLAAWRAASGQDRNSLSADSRFLAAPNNDLRLKPDSPCVDAGVNSFWMFGATDAGANPRIVGRSADLGAYELKLRTMVRVFLQGAYQGSELMSAALSQIGYLPKTSPYAEDPRSVAAVPSNATDWVLLQFRQTTNGPAVLSRSVFLNRNGFIVDDSGFPGINASLSPVGAYHVVVKHRNHLAAMSASPIAFIDQTLLCDFTTNANIYFGGTAACVTVAGTSGSRFALRTGDVDGDGEVAALDQAVRQSQSIAFGYRRGDVSLDGYTSTYDDWWILSNLEAASPVPRPETLLTPALRISPARQTVQAGEPLTLTGATTATTLLAADNGTTGQVFAISQQALHWGFARNDSGSGATLATSGLSQAVYTSGSVTGRTDIVQGWDDADALGRSILNVFDTQAAAIAGQALVIAGRTSASDTLWPATDYLADTAYTTLRYRGFAKENIHYLSPEPNQDVDGNGYLDDIDAESTFAEAACAFTNRVAGTDHLFVYLVDHGGNSSGNGYFRLNATETLTAAQLDDWLDGLQDTNNTEVIVLLDFCYAGSFLPALAYTGTASRIVIAACGDDQPSYFVSGGLVSFSGAFFSGVMLGYDVSNCFSMAASAMASYQTALLDDDQDGLYTANDGTVSSGLFIGPTYAAAGDAPVIGEVCGNQVLTEETTATVWIGSVASVNPITRAWCLVIPPGHDPDPDNPVTDLPTFELAFDASDGHYSVSYDGFTAAGTYAITFYVQDAEGNVSLPRQAYIAQTGYDDRIILVAGGDTNSATWPAVEHLAELAYATFRLRLFTPDRMCILTPSGSHDFDGDGTNDVSGQAGCASLQAAIGEWAVTNTTDRLTLYLLGEGATNAFRLNATASLTTNALAGWVQAFQATNPVPVTLVLDFSGAGAFLPSLADTDDSPDVPRIAIASARAGQEALFANDGTVSFTQYLLSGIITGKTLGEAFIDARRAIRRISGNVRQKAQLDDTRNGVANEKDIDGAVAAVTYLGSAFVTGADAPSIESVMPPVVLHIPGAAVTLWASGVSGMYPISNVWCVVTPPDATPTDELQSIPLVWNAASNRYEAVATGFTQPGAYVLTCYARDTAGTLSAPEQSEVILADAYEPDDETAGASFYYGPFQSHTFHTSNDVDWVRTYLVSNFIYEVETDLISERLDSVIDFYREGADGTLALLDHVDEEGGDLGEYTGIDYPESGWYWVRLSAYAGGTNQIGAYTFSIELPAAATCSLIVLGVDDVDNSALPAGSYATVTGKGNKSFSGSTTVTYTGLAAGTYTVTVPAPANHICREDPNTPGQVQNVNSFYYGNPRRVAVSGSWTIAGFEFLSKVTVTAGVVRDAWTGAFLDNAQLTFTAASGSLLGTVVDGSIMLTSYSTDWKSQTGGLFPAGVVLGACSWDLAVSRTGYATTTQDDAIHSPAIGASLSLGTVYLVPTDSNGNAVADSWEAQYFPAGMNPDADVDNDGIPNRSEYLCGTDPTNTASVLRFLNAHRTAGGMSLSWSVAGGRIYRILSLASPTNTGAAVTNGPWEAAYGETTQSWTDTGAALHNTRFYRIRLSTP